MSLGSSLNPLFFLSICRGLGRWFLFFNLSALNRPSKERGCKIRVEELGFSSKAVEYLYFIDRHFDLQDLMYFLKRNGFDPFNYDKVAEGLYRLKDGEYRAGYLAPSMFTAYYRCPRRLWIEARHGRLVTEKELFWILRGRLQSFSGARSTQASGASSSSWTRMKRCGA